MTSRDTLAVRLVASFVLFAVVAGSFTLGSLVAPRSADAVPNYSQVAKALDYMHACQNSDGGFGEKGKGSADAVTAWTIVAIASAGEDPNAWKVGGKSPLDYLAKQSADWTTTTAVARTTLAVVAARKKPKSFGGVDLVAKLQAVSDKDEVNAHIWAIIALKAAGQTVPTMVDWLKARQNSDSGWGWSTSVGSDSNDTAAAIEALAAAGAGTSTAVKNAITKYLPSCQNADGGFAYQHGSASDANSTAWVVQGLLAAGETPSSSSWPKTKGGHTPFTALNALQAADGSENFKSDTSPANPLLTAVEAVPAFAERPFPVSTSPSGVESAWLPVITIGSPAKGSTIAAGSGSVLTFGVSDGAGTGVASSFVSVNVDGTSLAASVTAGTGRAVLPSLSKAKHTVTVTAIDRAGNRTELTGWTFTVGTTASAAAAATAGGSTALGVATPYSVPTTVVGGVVATGVVAPTAAAATVGAQPTTAAVAARRRVDATAGLWVALVGTIAAAAVGVVIAIRRRRAA